MCKLQLLKENPNLNENECIVFLYTSCDVPNLTKTLLPKLGNIRNGQ